MTPEIVGSLVRTLLGTVAGGLVTQGVMTGDQMNAIAGGISAAIVLGWSIWQKYRAKV